MLYTQEQLISFGNSLLKHHNITASVTHADRANWEEANNVQPLQAGQELTIETIDGLKITAEISTIIHTDKL